MSIIFKKISKIFNVFKKNSPLCDGCAYYKEPTDECKLFLITEDYKLVKAKNGCESYLSKEQIFKR